MLASAVTQEHDYAPLNSLLKQSAKAVTSNSW
jgi:hypothetical protein